MKPLSASVFSIKNLFLPLLLLGLAIFMSRRIANENTLWCNEIITAIVSNLPLAELNEKAVHSSHPATYFMAIKAWNTVGRALGIEPGIAWGRLPGLLGLFTFILEAWQIGRRLLGGNGARLLTLMLALGPQPLWVASDMRGYALVTPALGVCFFLLFWMSEALRQGNLSRSAATRCWLLYALAGSLAVASLYLSLIILGLLAAWWLGLCWRVGRPTAGGRQEQSPSPRRMMLAGGAAAHIFILLWLFPIALHVAAKAAYHPAGARAWMTPPTLANLGRVFALWHPWGVWAEAITVHQSYQLIAGALSVLMPLGAALAWLCLARRKEATNPPAAFTGERGYGPPLRLALAGLTLGALNVLTLWTIDHIRPNLAFHGPRYTICSAPIWCAGLAGLALGAARAWRRPRLAWLLALPWLACNLAALTLETRRLTDLFPAQIIQEKLGPPAKAETPLYVMPKALIPYFARTLAGRQPRGIDALNDSRLANANVRILNLNMWADYANANDQALLMLITEGKLARSAHWTARPDTPFAIDCGVCDLTGFQPQALKDLARGVFRAPAAPAHAKGALAIILPVQLKPDDGWHTQEIDPTLGCWRWSSQPRAAMPLNIALQPGTYELQLQGLREPYPRAIEPLKISIEGAASPLASPALPAGPFDLKTSFTLSRPLANPRLIFEHSVFASDKIYPGFANDRKFGWKFHEAVIRKLPSPRP